MQYTRSKAALRNQPAPILPHHTITTTTTAPSPAPKPAPPPPAPVPKPAPARVSNLAAVAANNPMAVLATRSAEPEDPEAARIDWLGWMLLHGLGMAADRIVEQSASSGPRAAEAFKHVVTAVSKIHPCSICRTHMSRFDQPADIPGKAFEWTVHLHNDVNRRTNKPTMPLHEARSNWSDRVPVLDQILEFFKLTASKTQHAVLADASHVPLQWTHPSVRATLLNLPALAEAGGQGAAFIRVLKRCPLPPQLKGGPVDAALFQTMQRLFSEEMARK